MRSKEKQQQINDMRALLDWLDEHPDLDGNLNYNGWRSWHLSSQKKQFLEEAKMLGTCEKVICGDNIEATKRFGDFTAVVSINREAVCKKIVVRREVEIEEWQCEPLLSLSDLAEVTAA